MDLHRHLKESRLLVANKNKANCTQRESGDHDCEQICPKTYASGTFTIANIDMISQTMAKKGGSTLLMTSPSGDMGRGSLVVYL